MVANHSVQCQTKSHRVGTTTIERPILEHWIGVQTAWYFPCTQTSSHLNLGYVPVYSNGEFDPASLPRHPRCDITYTAFYHVLMGKIYYFFEVDFAAFLGT